MNRSRLYTILGIACVMGYSWLIFSFWQKTNGGNFTTCFIKNITGIPCPSCGSTRALMLLCKGDVIASIIQNPIGIVLAVIMVVAPLWLAYDLILKKNTLHQTYQKMEARLTNKRIFIPLVLALMANWIWNIYKDL